MTSESGFPFGGRPWTLLLGPGERLGELIPLLEAVPPSDDAGARPTLEQLEDLGGLFCEFPDSGRIVLDTRFLPREEVGLVQRFLVRYPRWRMHLLDEDPTGGAVRRLLRNEGVEWLPSPVEVTALRELVQPPPEFRRDPALPHPLPEREPPADVIPTPLGATEPPETELVEESEEPFDEEEQDERGTLDPAVLDRIQRILEGESVEPPVGEREPEAPEMVAPDAGVQLPDLTPDSRGVAPFPRPPSYFKNQIADLADIVQCVDQNLGLAREETKRDNAVTSAAVARRLEELSGDVARLRHFTQTLSYLAAAPVAGHQLIDLAPLLQEMLTARREESDAPRFLLRSSGSLMVRTEKRLLSQAFDAILYLSHHGAGPEGTVRVDAREDEDPDEVLVSIRFPAGPLHDVEPHRIMEPYALRRILPELGANSLGAAAGIFAGQGGSLDLIVERGGGLEWVVRLPSSAR